MTLAERSKVIVRDIINHSLASGDFCRLLMGLDARKPVFGVSEKAILKPGPSATGTSLKIEILFVSSLDLILSKKRITKALISLRECAGWSAPLLFANHRRQVFSRRGPDKLCKQFEPRSGPTERSNRLTL